MSADACIFCKIFRGELPADVVARTDDALAFRDLHPQAPSHVLVVPKRHVEHLSEFMNVASPSEVHALFSLAAHVGSQAERGYRLVTNEGSDAGQTVFHLHLHVLSGVRMPWPP